jgi:formamidopyrimidine-DNA glycosylase
MRRASSNTVATRQWFNLYDSRSKMNFLEHPFGMTGNLKYYEDGLEEPTHASVLIYFGSAYHLAFDNQRLFGKVDLI